MICQKFECYINLVAKLNNRMIRGKKRKKIIPAQGQALTTKKTGCVSNDLPDISGWKLLDKKACNVFHSGFPSCSDKSRDALEFKPVDVGQINVVMGHQKYIIFKNEVTWHANYVKIPS